LAQYTHLPIYIEAFSLLKEFYERVPKFSKQYKYTLGTELTQTSVKVVQTIITINSTWDKETRLELLDRLVLKLENMIIHLRIANELNQLGGKRQYLFLSEKIVSLVRQAEGWKKSFIR